MGDVVDPCLARLRAASLERLAQARRQRARLLVARRRVGTGHDGPEVAQTHVVDRRRHCLGFVAPLGRPQPGEQLLGQRQQRVGADLGFACSASPCVLVLDGLTHGGKTAPEDLLGHRPVLDGQRGDDRLPMGPPRAEPLGLGASRRR